MWNPLGLPLAVLRLVSSLPRVLELLEDAVREAAGLNRSAADARKLLEESIGKVDELNRRGDRMIEELAAAREVFAEAMTRVDRLSGQGDRLHARVPVISCAIPADSNVRCTSVKPATPTMSSSASDSGRYATDSGK